MAAVNKEKLDKELVPAESNVNYEAMEKERTAYLQAEINQKLRAEAAVKGQSLQRIILHSIVIGDYVRATQDIDHFIKYKSKYPNYPIRVKRYAEHCKQLIEAIKIKRNFPNLSSLNIAKQKEILDHVLNHFNDLKQNLKIMEKMAKEVVLNDLRSTAWVLRISSYVVMMLVLTMFFISFENEVGRPIWVHFNVMTDELFHKIWRAFMG